MNKLALSGEVTQREPLRYTPAGLPLLRFAVHHVSEQSEATMARRVECELTVVALGEIAAQADRIAPGDRVEMAGFLARKSLKSTQLELHLKALKII